MKIVKVLLYFRYEKQFDDYGIIMTKALADRLAEVCSVIYKVIKKINVALNLENAVLLR